MGQPPTTTDAELIRGSASTELAASRTNLAFERTLLATDRTLMAMVRTSLSLIGFGFTIYQVFGKASRLLPDADVTGRRLGMALLVMGILLLTLGIRAHMRFDRELNRRRERLYALNLLHRGESYQKTPTLLIAIALLLAGVVALASISFRII
jgi:putative membrane protein